RDAVLTASTPLLSDEPNKPDDRGLPPATKGDCGWEAPSTILDQVMSPDPPGRRSSVLRKATGSPALLAMEPSTTAIEDRMPFETEYSDSPSAPLILQRSRWSSMLSKEANSKSAISISLQLIMMMVNDEQTFFVARNPKSVGETLSFSQIPSRRNEL